MRASAYPLIDADEAAALVLEHTPVLATERVALADAIGRVLAQDLVAAAPLPAFPASAVDGYAVRAADAGRSSHAGSSVRIASTIICGAAEVSPCSELTPAGSHIASSTPNAWGSARRT